MQITLSMLVQCFYSTHPMSVALSIPPGVIVKSIKLLNRNTEHLSPGCLYISDNQTRLLSASEHGAITLLVSSKAPADRDGITVVVVSELGAAEICNVFNELFVRLMEWNHRMDMTFSENQSVGDMLQFCGDYLPYPMYLVSGCLQLIAHVGTLRSVSYAHEFLVETGCIHPEAVDTFAEHGLFQYGKNPERQTVAIPHEEFYELFTAIEAGNALWGYFMMVVPRNCYSFCALDLFEAIGCRLKQFILLNDAHNLHSRKLHENILIDLIERGNYSGGFGVEGLGFFRFPLISNFYLLYFKGYEINQLPYLLGREKLPHQTLASFYYKDGLLQLICFEGQPLQAEERCTDYLKWLDAELRERQLQCGASERFSEIDDIWLAYIQATEAMHLGIGLQKNATGSHLHLYSNYCLYHQFINTDPLICCRSVCLPAIMDIWKDDRKSGKNSLEILERFLANDRNASQTGAELFMHRNNVVYHITRLTEKYGLVMDNVDQRQRMVNSIKIIHMLEAGLIEPERTEKNSAFYERFLQKFD